MAAGVMVAVSGAGMDAVSDGSWEASASVGASAATPAKVDDISETVGAGAGVADAVTRAGAIGAAAKGAGAAGGAGAAAAGAGAASAGAAGAAGAGAAIDGAAGVPSTSADSVCSSGPDADRNAAIDGAGAAGAGAMGAAGAAPSCLTDRCTAIDDCVTRPIESPTSRNTSNKAAAAVANVPVHMPYAGRRTRAGVSLSIASLSAKERGTAICGSLPRSCDMLRMEASSAAQSVHWARCASTSRVSRSLTSASANDDSRVRSLSCFRLSKNPITVIPVGLLTKFLRQKFHVLG